MPGLCHCVSTATRNRVNLHNNLCKHCGKKIRKISSDNENFADSEEYFYENTKDILEGSPNYINTLTETKPFLTLTRVNIIVIVIILVIVGSIVLIVEDYLFVKTLSHVCLKFLKTILIVSLVL